MKRAVWLIGIIVGASRLFAQQVESDSWSATLDNKILATGVVGEVAIGFVISADKLQRDHSFKIEYKTIDKKRATEWKRSFMVMDEKDVELIRRDSTSQLILAGDQWQKLFAGRKQLRLYTISVPTDPALAARVRVRRIQLCTIGLQ